MNQTTKRTIVWCTCDQQTLGSVCASTHYIKQASWIARRRCILYDQRRIWSECDVTVTLFIPLWTARLSKVNTISECSDQNVQLRRLTGVFACRTWRFVKPIDCRRYIRLAKALIRLLMCRLRVCRLIRLFVQVIIGFTKRDLFLQTITLNILGKVFSRHFEIFFIIFPRKQDLHFMQIVSIAWNVKSCFLGNKTNNDFLNFFFFCHLLN